MNSRIKICFDHLCFWERYGGVSKYFVELLKRLPSENVKLLLKYTNNEYIREYDGIKTKEFLPNINFRGKSTLISQLGKLTSVPGLIKGDFDIYHPTHYDCYGFKFLPARVKSVATIHDLNFFKIPQFYKQDSRNKINQEKIIEKVDHIITISQKSNEDLQELFNVPQEKISVIYHGVDSSWIRNAPFIGYAEPYFLYVGRRNPYKNFSLVLEAMTQVTAHHKDIKLYCAGLPPTQHEIQLLADKKLAQNVEFIQASNDELANLYRQAIGFIFPSFYEGFGLPILEAMSADCPTIISDASCFPEIAGDASMYFNPNDSEELAHKMNLLIDDSELRNNLIRAGRERVGHFSWEKSAEQHMKVYQSLI